MEADASGDIPVLDDLSLSAKRNKDKWLAFLQYNISMSAMRETIVSKLGAFCRETGEALMSPEEYADGFTKDDWMIRVKLSETQASVLLARLKADKPLSRQPTADHPSRDFPSGVEHSTQQLYVPSDG